MGFSVVDLSPVPKGGTAADVYASTVETTKQAKRLGYSRLWVAEHRGMANTLAGTTPEMLLGHLTAEADSIRLGSGVVLLNRYSPFKAAEQFDTLNGLAPGHIDTGLERANGSPAADQALGTDWHVEDPDGGHAEKIGAVINHLYDDYPGEHPYADLEIPRGNSGLPVPWVLGSSPSSTIIVGKLGLPYYFAGFIRPQFAVHSFEEYRESFQSSSLGGGIGRPHGIVAVNAAYAETDEEVARLRAVAEASCKRMHRGEVGTRPTVGEVIDGLGGVPGPAPATLGAKEWPRAISGSPGAISGLLDQLTECVGADEMMIQHIVSNREDGLHSYELLTEGIDLVWRTGLRDSPSSDRFISQSPK